MDDRIIHSLVSMALKTLQEQGKSDAVSVIRNSKYYVDWDRHDNWNGGIDYYILVFIMKRRDFLAIESNIDAISSDILDTIRLFNKDEQEVIDGCDIKAELEIYIDWMNVLPNTKDSTIQLIRDEWKLLEEIATGKRRYKEDGVEQQYRERHKQICNIAKGAGFDYPIKCNSLAEWWIQIREIEGYSERRAEITKIFSPLITMLEKTEESETIDFGNSTKGPEAVKRAIDDANYMIGAGRYESAVDRLHTAFQGHLRSLVKKHGGDCLNDDNLSALYSKLHYYYADTIQPPDMAERIKKILRSGSSIVSMVNEIRNNNTIAHPNEQLIQKREAELVIHIVRAMVNYIDGIEREELNDNVC